ncbi:PREDICTED: VQ motif-containing protein 11-like [Ipomoea nil]|uniref:VQ motif-containing protein 11-like n=1 Tax=Ipomoea nil TaxID=35883 RepID=UPI000901FDF8|nr:PREDICTED: VQ motif-containing protein 11-like [Ipomoea nil]
MPSSSSNPNPLNNTNTHNVPYAPLLPCGFPPNTTFVQTDPSNFQAVVQRLTGATQDPSVQKLPVVLPARRAGKPNSAHHRPPFKLHERRLQTSKKLQITLNGGGGGTVGRLSPSASAAAATRVVMGSPVSPLEMLARRSPTSAVENEEEEERGISEKGFCFRPSPLSTPRGGGRSEPPELLPLFPLHSPSTRHHSSCS